MYPTSAYTFHITIHNLQQYKDALNERLADFNTPIGNDVIALDTAIREFQKQLDLEWAEARWAHNLAYLDALTNAAVVK